MQRGELRFSYGLPVTAGAGLLDRAVLLRILEAPSGFEPEMEVLQLGTLPRNARTYAELLEILRVGMVPSGAKCGRLVPGELRWQLRCHRCSRRGS